MNCKFTLAFGFLPFGFPYLIHLHEDTNSMSRYKNVYLMSSRLYDDWQDYAKTDGLEYICPHCSITNFKKKSQKITNGY